MTDAQALSTLLTIEAFMLAVVSLTASLFAPGRDRVPDLPMSGYALAMSAAIGVCILALGATFAWVGMYAGGSLRPWREVVVAVVLLLAVLAQPVFAVLTARGVRSKR
nr:hypothetical protein [Mycolicibacterium komanii]CRL77951.1 hypothetical protein CPGR_04973 [Mycolicibacterium komanii]